VGTVHFTGAVAAEGDDRTVRMRWTPPSDVRASDVTSLTIYWCLAASRRRGACAVSFHCPVHSMFMLNSRKQETCATQEIVTRSYTNTIGLHVKVTCRTVNRHSFVIAYKRLHCATRKENH